MQLRESDYVGAERLDRRAGAVVEAGRDEQQARAAVGGQRQVRRQLVPVREPRREPGALRDAFGEPREVRPGLRDQHHASRRHRGRA